MTRVLVLSFVVMLSACAENNLAIAGVKTPWADYPPNVTEWAVEIRNLPEDASSRDWLYSHPDGRRWIGMKVGTYWVDRAMARSKRSSADLAGFSTQELFALIEP